MFDFGDTWIRFLRDGNETVLLPAVERILAAREAAWAEKYAAVVGERDEWEQTALDRHLAHVPDRLRADAAEAALATALREKAEDRARVEAVEALHDGTHWCFNADEQAEVYEPGSKWWPCPTRAALATPTATEDE